MVRVLSEQGGEYERRFKVRIGCLRRLGTATHGNGVSLEMKQIAEDFFVLVSHFEFPIWPD